MPDNILNYAAGREFDAGRFTARYFQVLAGLSLAWMAIGPLFTHAFNLDLSFIILLWAASALKRHSPVARKCVLVVCAFGIALSIASIFMAIEFGTDHMTIGFGRPIHNQTIWQVLAAAVAMGTLTGIPLIVLLLPRARRQFLAVPDAPVAPERAT